ncbi:MAG TPA: peptidylprolyl isomerase [Terracidiphilus sp.]|nr:peptidylprolyl isomerase [Terracidiphilus sp.]
MNLKFSSIGLFVFLAIGAAGAQIASHTPALKSTPTPDASMMSPLVATSTPVAHVNGTVLTQTDLVREEYAIFPYARQHNGIPKDLEPEIREGAMRMMIFEELVYQEALRLKMSVSPVRMQKAEMDFRKTFATPEDYNAFLQSEFHGSQQLLEQKIRRSLLIDALLRIEVKSKGQVTPAEVRSYYDKNPDRFRIPESYIFQTISAIAPENATPDQMNAARARAEKELPQARAAKTNNDFGLLAEKESDDDYRVMEGQHKAATVDQLPPPVVQALKTMKAGDVSNVIQVGQAFTILRLNAHAPAEMEKFEDVRAKLASALEQRKANQLRAAFDQKLRQNAKIEEP